MEDGVSEGVRLRTKAAAANSKGEDDHEASLVTPIDLIAAARPFFLIHLRRHPMPARTHVQRFAFIRLKSSLWTSYAVAP